MRLVFQSSGFRDFAGSIGITFATGFRSFVMMTS